MSSEKKKCSVKDILNDKTKSESKCLGAVKKYFPWLGEIVRKCLALSVIKDKKQWLIKFKTILELAARNVEKGIPQKTNKVVIPDDTDQVLEKLITMLNNINSNSKNSFPDFDQALKTIVEKYARVIKTLSLSKKQKKNKFCKFIGSLSHSNENLFCELRFDELKKKYFSKVVKKRETIKVMSLKKDETLACEHNQVQSYVLNEKRNKYDHSSKPYESCITSSSLKQAVLEIIASKWALTAKDLKLYAAATLSVVKNVPQEVIDACVIWLFDNGFIRRQTVADGERFAATRLGLACFAANFAPEESLVLLDELKKVKECLVVEDDFHLVYQITPTHVSDEMNQIDWLHYLTLWEELDSSKKRVAEVVGVEERFLIRFLKGIEGVNPLRHSRQLAIHRRFYGALALHQLMNEVPLSVVAQTYKMNKGFLKTLQHQAATYAGIVTIFCQRLGWDLIHSLLENFQSRLLFGVKEELVELFRLPLMESRTARLLYDAGLTNIASISTASREKIDARRFQTDTKEDQDVVDAQFIIDEARKLIQLELGVQILWDKPLTGSRS